MANIHEPSHGLTELNARGKRREAELERKAAMTEAGNRRVLEGRPRASRFRLLRRVARLVRGGGD